jgi:hypothetical protein
MARQNFFGLFPQKRAVFSLLVQSIGLKLQVMLLSPAQRALKI